MRRLAGLVAHLPPGCALHRALDPEGYGADWSHREELLALLIEVLDRHDRHFIEANRKKGAKRPKPIHIPRPRDISRNRAKRPATPEELRRIVGEVGGAVVEEASSNGG